MLSCVVFLLSWAWWLVNNKSRFIACNRHLGMNFSCFKFSIQYFCTMLSISSCYTLNKLHVLSNTLTAIDLSIYFTYFYRPDEWHARTTGTAVKPSEEKQYQNSVKLALEWICRSTTYHNIQHTTSECHVSVGQICRVEQVTEELISSVVLCTDPVWKSFSERSLATTSRLVHNEWAISYTPFNKFQ